MTAALSPQEQQCYSGLLQGVPFETDGRVNPSVAREFLQRSQVQVAALQQIWSMVDRSGSGRLSFEELCMALRLIGHVQAQRPLSEAALSTPPPSAPELKGGSSSSSYSTRRRPLGSTPTAVQLRKYARVFLRTDTDHDGHVLAHEVYEVFKRSGLPEQLLAKIWELIDHQRTGRIGFPEFVAGMHMVSLALAQGQQTAPSAIPGDLLSYAMSIRESPGMLAAQGARSRGSPSNSARSLRSTGSTRSLRARGPLPSERELRKYARLFVRSDLDDDALLSLGEVKDVFRQAGLSAADVDAVFNMVDVYDRSCLAFPEFAVGVHIASRLRTGDRSPLEGDRLPRDLEKYMYSIRHSAEELCREGTSRSASASRSRPTTPPPTGPLTPRSRPNIASNSTIGMDDWGTSSFPATFDDFGDTAQRGRSPDRKSKKKDKHREKDEKDEEEEKKEQTKERGEEVAVEPGLSGDFNFFEAEAKEASPLSLPLSKKSGERLERPERDPDSWKQPSTRLGMPIDGNASSDSPPKNDPHFAARLQEIWGSGYSRDSRPRTSIAPLYGDLDLGSTSGQHVFWPITSKSADGSPVMKTVLGRSMPDAALLPPTSPPTSGSLSLPASGLLSAIRPNFRTSSDRYMGSAGTAGPDANVKRDSAGLLSGLGDIHARRRDEERMSMLTADPFLTR